ncbi:MAG: ABC transporter ATP-binding protein [Oscillospiraceae bacterium]|nr:ABC transporter ATP-binding protein [Oscillospiraceae bacterium]MBQ9148236.1 ABC transporter ATP-binding protein [Oscillospiraceae bacterium]
MYAVEMLGITKRFGNFTANNKVNLCVEKGEIHCLLGENGAGKTTLMNVLFGLYKPEEGILKINGQEVVNHSSRNAFHLGLGMVHQHFMLVDALTVWENVIVGNELGKFTINKKESIKAVQALADQYNFDLDVTQKVSELSVGKKQRVEILKTLYRGANIIILDEPTAVLSPPEVLQLLDILRDMKKEGKTIVFITHKLNETKAVADHVTVLRAGESIETVAVEGKSVTDLANMMVGHEVSFDRERPEKTPGDVVLSLKGLRLLPNAQNTVSFDIRAGEIVGIAGVEGNGQQQLEELIMGFTKCKEGSITLLGDDITKWSTKKRCGKGIGYIPSDRHQRAILANFSIEDNYLLGTQFSEEYVHNGMIKQKHLHERTLALMKDYDVRAVDEKQTIGSLSGGNQQKMVLSREVAKNSDFVIACQPVRGLDIGAIQYIHEILLDLRQQGKAVLLISAELTDIRQLSDRIAVLYKGEVLALKKNEDFTTEAIGLLMAGQKERE